MLKFTEYSEKALHTIKPHASKELELADWALGLAGEAGEVLEVAQSAVMSKMSFAKEVGDVLWYCSALLNALDMKPKENGFSVFTLEELGYKEVPRMLMAPAYLSTIICVETSKVVEKVKHLIMHKEAIPANMLEKAIYRVISQLGVICYSVDIRLEDVAELNIAKLAHRYEKNNGKYSSKVSADRHEAEERFEDTEIYKELRDRICLNSKRAS